MQQIIHTDLQKLETAIAEGLEFQGEYVLGIADNQIFPSRDLETAALYVIQGGEGKDCETMTFLNRIELR